MDDRDSLAEEHRLPGGGLGGAVRVGATVRRTAGPWTPAVHALLHHLELAQFDGAPRALGIDAEGREILSFLPGASVGATEPWPAWVHSDGALVDVGRWLHRYHDAVAGFVPPAGAVWRTAVHPWRPGDIIGHNDAAPYNAVWRPEPVPERDRLVGFFDWDLAGPCPPLWDLAYVVFSWGPLHARDVVAAEGFARFDDRPRRVRLLLDAYGYTGTIAELLDAVRRRVEHLIDTVLTAAAAGDPGFVRMVADGTVDAQRRALAALRREEPTFLSGSL